MATHASRASAQGPRGDGAQDNRRDPGLQYWADDSVINLVYKVASYAYGPILGMFAFGMFTRLKVRDRWMPLVALAAPALSALVRWWALKTWDYQIGFELLIYNAAFTMIGMLLLVKRHEK